MPTKITNSVDVRALLKAGAHFGHKTAYWNPKMKPYIHSERSGIYIIDLLKTADLLEEAAQFAESVAAKGKQVLFVGTKRHLREVVQKAAGTAKMPYVTQRWFGGMLTNFETISARVKYLQKLEEKVDSGQMAETVSKREVGEAKEEIAKLNLSFGGIRELKGTPGAIFVADCLNDRIATAEAKRLGVPVIGIVDTNADPSPIDYPIPCNDDAVGAVSLVADYIAQAVLRGAAQQTHKKEEASEDK